ncbi:MAG: heparinase II/III family protein, partial [Bacteroidales bacterium]
QKTGDGIFLNREDFLQRITDDPGTGNRYPRLSGAILVWLSQYEEKKRSELPVYWKADGWNPIAILGSEPGEDHGFYLAIKGGSATVNHSNLDAGSFVFELDGVRWSVDPGNQGYYELEQTIGSSNLWDQSQDSYRWNLLTKGNIYHSTLTVSDERHKVEGFAPISEIIHNNGEKSVVVDLHEIFQGYIENTSRKFTKVNDYTLRIEDNFRVLDNTESLTWAMITRADVQTVENGAILKQDERTLKLKIINPPVMNVSVVSLNPPPLPYDKFIPNLKRLEIRIPAYILKESEEPGIVVELSGAGEE